MPNRQRIGPVRFKPGNFTFNVWGGHWIPRLKRMPPPRRPVGESWEFSAHPAHPSRIHGWGGNVSLARLLKTRIPFLLKFIDARENLSLQVHPPQSYARRVEKQAGKTESWVIMEAGSRPGDGFIYLGFRPRRGALRGLFKAALKNGQAPKILSYLNKIRVRPGEVYHVPPGTIHAVGCGVRLFEIQQTSDLTYRVWDWNRPVARPLHLEKAFDVLSFRPRPARAFQVKPGRGLREQKLIVDHKAGYALHRIQFRRRGESLSQSAAKRFLVFTVVEGSVVVDGFKVNRGQTVLVPKRMKRFEIRSAAHRASVLKSFCP